VTASRKLAPNIADRIGDPATCSFKADRGAPEEKVIGRDRQFPIANHNSILCRAYQCGNGHCAGDNANYRNLSRSVEKLSFYFARQKPGALE
jgi:hypothetical protein